MTIDYSFKITGLNKLLLYIDEEGNQYNNVITKINFYYQGIDSEDNTKAIYNSSVILPKPTSSNYKSYDLLQESDIITWLESLISTEEITLIKSVISNNILDQQTKTTSLPWTT